jgi:hypothetical protein
MISGLAAVAKAELSTVPPGIERRLADLNHDAKGLGHNDAVLGALLWVPTSAAPPSRRKQTAPLIASCKSIILSSPKKHLRLRQLGKNVMIHSDLGRLSAMLSRILSDD